MCPQWDSNILKLYNFYISDHRGEIPTGAEAETQKVFIATHEIQFSALAHERLGWREEYQAYTPFHAMCCVACLL